jgi:protease I
MDQRLKGRRIAALAADGFEKVELVVPMKALRAAGARVDVISLRHGNIRGVNLHEPASRVHVDKTIAEANPDDYDGLLLPGGFINPDLLRQSAEARAFVRAFDQAGKPIASLCHGPWVLASAGLLQGRTLTSWPGVRDDLVNAGATWLDQPFVRDGNLATSRGPQDLIPFVQGCLDLFAEHAPIPRTAHPRVSRSAPQANEPPAIVLGAMKWLPKPSLRTAVGLGALAAVVIATRPRREQRRSRSIGRVSATDESSLVETRHHSRARAAAHPHAAPARQ